ncbi:hypothetical protein JCM25156A_05270 [Komagataeibacter kakiaceti JCM 25156]|uniref:chemotaxis protein CheW n=1 Tax=Komagataeibacter kakiaceti TaxID=943261 RepID=UPI000472B5E5|nr:chemotaxis protein CheW [Komagataeibacter kakiaceti]
MDHATAHQGGTPGPCRAEIAPVMVFRVGERLYGLPAGQVVRECMPVPELLPLAVALPHVSGWFRLGAARVVVLDLGVLLGERARAVSQPLDLLYRPLLLCNLEGGGHVALLVDGAREVTRAGVLLPGAVDGAGPEVECAGQELELKDGGIACMLRMADILTRGERMRLDDLMARTQARAALWAGTEGADEGEGEDHP